MRGRVVPLVLVALASPFAWTAPADAAVVRCDGHRATIVGTAGNDVINGTRGNDVIVGRQGDDTIRGLGGNDRICGGFGADRLLGGPGSDRLFGGKDRVALTDEGTTERTGDVLRGGRGNDRLVPGRDTRRADDVSYDAISWDNAPHRMVIDLRTGVATGDGRDSFVGAVTWVVGSRFADVVEGGSGRDRIQGGRGSDVLRGRGGNDRIVADEGSGAQVGDDRVWGGRGDDELTSAAGQDEVKGGPGNDIIDDFGNSADRLWGGSGNDSLFGQLVDNGKPQGYWGGKGIDQVHLFTTLLNPNSLASTGTWDMLTGRLVYDLDGPLVIPVAGFQGADLATYGTTWTIQGSAGADDLRAAGTKGTSFSGLAGNDTFFGSENNDVFNGGSGTDRATMMGVGDDTCVSVEVIVEDDCENVTP